MEVHGRVMEGLWKVNGRLNGRLMETFCQNPKVAWLPFPVLLTFLENDHLNHILMTKGDGRKVVKVLDFFIT